MQFSTRETQRASSSSTDPVNEKGSLDIRLLESYSETDVLPISTSSAQCDIYDLERRYPDGSLIMKFSHEDVNASL